MLVIRRRSGESVFLGEDIEVEILDIESSQVKLGIRAPREVVILRKEVRWTELANRGAARSDLPERLDGLVRGLR